MSMFLRVGLLVMYRVQQGHLALDARDEQDIGAVIEVDCSPGYSRVLWSLDGKITIVNNDNLQLANFILD